MLVLSRKKDETILIKIPGQDDIKITVVKIDNRNKVRIGVEANKEITVLRQELDQKPISLVSESKGKKPNQISAKS
jgi:carbon storage regulator CsrA